MFRRRTTFDFSVASQAFTRAMATQLADNGYPEYRRTEAAMSATIWCDIDDPETNLPHAVGHPFSEKDPNRQHFSRTGTERVRTGNSYGNPTYQDREIITAEMDICGYHWEKQNPFQSRPEEIESGEAKNEDYLKGYREGILHGELASLPGAIGGEG